ncbi:hypothetical protein NE237_004334 [Protea cynaroides]|uniref:Uncharacterized protein n=1 Tax=Protea cynaroides TaxID=273540 RepID=A0A9Q0QTG5_9MAGN|nr:hypothetical protein NE237_004334 [Protea cynaroides]
MLSQKQAEQAIVTNYSETTETDGKDEEPEVQSKFSMKSVLWHGGSVYDAWFSCASNQVAQVLLTLPYSFSQLGMLSGILFQIFYGIMGSWTAYLISVLYLEYRSRKEKENVNFKNHVIQWFEVLDGLLGPYWKAIGLAFNCTMLVFGSVIQLIACASNIYYINDRLDKRTWTYIFGACCATTVFIPSFHNYRIWAFLGLGMTTYTAWYLTIAALVHGQVDGVQHTAPTKLVLYFTGATNILYTFGGHAVTVEIMHAMWKPQKFKYIYLMATLYVFTLTIPSASTVYWAFGDQLLNNSNAFALLPRTGFRDAAVILMLIHQFITFGFACTPLYFVWEKVIGMHDTKSICLRAVARLPVVIPIWFLAIIFPFFGPINSAVGALLVTFTVYIIPSLAHMLTYRKASARQDAAEKPPFFLKSWTAMSHRHRYEIKVISLITEQLRLSETPEMNVTATFRNSFSPILQCSSCYNLRFHPAISSSVAVRRRCFPRRHLQENSVTRRKPGIVCRVTETETEPESNNDKETEMPKDGEMPLSSDPLRQIDSQPLFVDQEKDNLIRTEMLDSTDAVEDSTGGTKDQGDIQEIVNLEVASGSPLPGVKLLNEVDRIPKETIDILKDQVFGFDTFFVTSQEPYEGGMLFKGNLRGKADKSYEKITKRMQDRFGDQYKLFLLINPEDDKPVAVVVPRKTLQPETTAVPEWFAAGVFGLVTIFTLLLRNVPALQSNFLSTFDNLALLKDGLPGAIATTFVLFGHELGHILIAKDTGIKLGVPYFVPSWQIGSFGAITRIVNTVPKREDLLKLAAAGPLAGFSIGLVLLLLGFILPPGDGIGIVVDASVFHESFLAGGIAKLLLGDTLKEGTPLSINPLVIWAWAGLLINAINSIPAGELDGGRISFALWGRKASSRLTTASIALLGLGSLFNDVSFYWVVLIFFLQRGPIAPLSEEISDPDDKYVALGISVLLLGLLVCLPYPLPFTSEAIVNL